MTATTDASLRLVLYRPEIAQNVGAATRAAACFSAGLDIIEPCGFPMGDKGYRRTAMDYGLLAPPTRHQSWATFCDSDNRRSGRLVLLSTKAISTIWETPLAAGDLLLMGQESAGVPDEVHENCDLTVRIPIAPDARSLNMATAAAIALAEARRQIRWP